MEDRLESDNYPDVKTDETVPPSWFKVGVVAAGSALAGGLLAAWWYRGTLRQLQQAGAAEHNTQFGISEVTPDDEE